MTCELPGHSGNVSKAFCSTFKV